MERKEISREVTALHALDSLIRGDISVSYHDAPHKFANVHVQGGLIGSLPVRTGVFLVEGHLWEEAM